VADLFDADAVEAFKDAMRDVTDTFHRYPVTLEQDGGDTELLAGRKVITEKFKAREEGEEIDEAYQLVFNREYLKDHGLVDGGDILLITYNDRVRMDGKRYHIVKLAEASFRDSKLMVVLEVVR